MASRSRRIEKVIGQASQRLHQSQNPTGHHTFDEVGASAGVRLLPPPPKRKSRR